MPAFSQSKFRMINFALKNSVFEENFHNRSLKSSLYYCDVSSEGDWKS